jgi:hypothetical protein
LIEGRRDGESRSPWEGTTAEAEVLYRGDANNVVYVESFQSNQEAAGRMVLIIRGEKIQGA